MIFDPRFEININKNSLRHIIKVIGVGGAGGNAVAHMAKMGVHEVDFVICNTDRQVLQECEVPNKLQLGIEITKGLGAGTEPEMGKKAAEESDAQIREILQAPTEMVFITAGMGGGTGTGAAPVIAKIARELNLLTVAVITDPFDFEGVDKIEHAKIGIDELKKYCDTVLIIKNDRLVEMFDDLAVDDAYAKADDVLAGAVKSIAELITKVGKMNVDFADVKKILKDAGQAVMGSSEAEGENRAKVAIEKALSSPLLNNCDISGAKRVLVSMSYSDDLPEYKMKMSEQKIITDFIESQIKRKASLFKHGYVIDRTLGPKIRVTIVAAGFDLDEPELINIPTPEEKEKLRFEEQRKTEEAIKKEDEYKLNQERRREEERRRAEEKAKKSDVKMMIQYFVENHYSTQNLDRPTFLRQQIDLIDSPTGKVTRHSLEG